MLNLNPAAALGTLLDAVTIAVGDDTGFMKHLSIVKAQLPPTSMNRPLDIPAIVWMVQS